MSPKNKKGAFSKNIKIDKRLVFGIKMSGNTPTGTIPKTTVYSRKDIENFKKRHYQIRVLGRAKESEAVQDSVKEGDVVYVMELIEKAHRTMRDIRNESRKEERKNGSGGGGGGGTPPDSGIFHRLVNEGELADCILQIVNNLFHGEKECEICKIGFNVYEFFLLTYYYFDYIRILEKKTQLAYCEYLNNKVFAGKNKVGVRNFNNYVKKDVYINFVELLKNNEDIKFHSRPELPRPKTENRLLAPFQEIGWKFQHSDYFDKLRRERDKTQTFNI